MEVRQGQGGKNMEGKGRGGDRAVKTWRSGTGQGGENMEGRGRDREVKTWRGRAEVETGQ